MEIDVFQHVQQVDPTARSCRQGMVPGMRSEEGKALAVNYIRRVVSSSSLSTKLQEKQGLGGGSLTQHIFACAAYDSKPRFVCLFVCLSFGPDH